MDLKTQSKVLYGQISWIKNDAKNNKLMVIYYLYNLVRMTTDLILQCAYLNFQGLVEKQSGNLEISGEVRARSKWIEDLMTSIGQINRAEGATGIFFHAILVSNILTYRIAILLYEDTFDILTKNEFLLRLAKPNEDKRILAERLTNCLDHMIKSNENFTQRIIDRVSINKNSESSDLFFDHNTLLKWTIDPYSNTTYNIKFTPSISRITGNFGVSKSNKLGHENNYRDDEESVDFEILSAEVELIEALHKQHEYLVKLRSNIDKVWPAYRNIGLIKELKRIGTFTYHIYGILGWFFCQLITSFAIRRAYWSLSTSSFDLENRRFTFVDRLQCAEYHIFAYFVMFAFIPDFCVYLTTTLYHLDHLKGLQSKTNQFYREIKRFEIWQQEGNNQCLKRSDFILYEQTKRDLKFECDKSLIELYINYSVFRREVRSAVKTSEKSGNQILTFLVIAMLPSLAYFNYIPKAHSSTIGVVVLLTTMIFNIPFLLSAIFDSACNRFAKHTWSIVAFLAGHNYELYLLSKKTMSRNIFKKKNNDDSSEFYHSNISSPRRGLKMIPDYVYYSKSFITPHSVFLWHRLIGSHKAVSDGFVSRIFGYLPVSYGGVLRFNHYVVWVSLVILSNQKSSITL